MLVFEERGKSEYPEKNLLLQIIHVEQTNSTHINFLTPSVGIKPQATLVGGECSHHCAIPNSQKDASQTDTSEVLLEHKLDSCATTINLHSDTKERQNS